MLEILKQKRALKDVPIERVTFNAITKEAVQTAMKHPRELDGALVDAYLARRALDYLVGFRLSPIQAQVRGNPGHEIPGGLDAQRACALNGGKINSTPLRQHSLPRTARTGTLGGQIAIRKRVHWFTYGRDARPEPARRAVGDRNCRRCCCR